MGPRGSALEFGGVTEILQAPRLCHCERGHVPVADAAPYTAAAIAGADGAGGLPSATSPVPAPASAAGILRVADRTGSTPVMSRSVSLSNVEVGLAVQVCYFAGALRVAGRTGPTPVMSRSDSLSKFVILPPS